LFSIVVLLTRFTLSQGLMIMKDLVLLKRSEFKTTIANAM